MAIDFTIIWNQYQSIHITELSLMAISAQTAFSAGFPRLAILRSGLATIYSTAADDIRVSGVKRIVVDSLTISLSPYRENMYEACEHNRTCTPTWLCSHASVAWEKNRNSVGRRSVMTIFATIFTSEECTSVNMKCVAKRGAYFVWQTLIGRPWQSPNSSHTWSSPPVRFAERSDQTSPLALCSLSVLDYPRVREETGSAL